MIDFITNLFSKRREQQENTVNETEQPKLDFKHITDSLLSQLQVKPQWRVKEAHTDTCDIEFQGGHFVLRVWDSHPYVHVSYPFFFTADVDEMDLVRGVVNKVNIESLFSCVIITTNEADNRLACHIQTIVCLDEESNSRKQNLCDALISCFSTRQEFDKYVSEARNSDDVDPEMEAVERRRTAYLLYEQAWTHQTEHIRVSNNDNVKLSLSEILRRMYDWHDIQAISMRLVVNTDISVVEDAMAYEPLDALLSSGGVVLADEATLLLDVQRQGFELRGDDSNMEQRNRSKVVVMLRVDHVSEKSVYVSVTLARDSVQNGGLRMITHNEAKSDSVTFIIARDLDDEQARQREFEFVMNDANDKMKQHRDDEISPIQRYLLSNGFDYGVAYNMFWGMSYARNKRYVEAAVHFENALGIMKERIHRFTQAQHDSLFNIMYSIGMCYSRLGRYEKAFYYLDYAAQANNNNYVIELIDCLVNSGDFRADAVLTNAINNVQQHIDENQDNDDFDIDAMQPYLRFLDERRIYLYIEQKRWHEAEKMLTRMLKEDENDDFALNELAYMNTLRQTDSGQL